MADSFNTELSEILGLSPGTDANRRLHALANKVRDHNLSGGTIQVQDESLSQLVAGFTISTYHQTYRRFVGNFLLELVKYSPSAITQLSRLPLETRHSIGQIILDQNFDILKIIATLLIQVHHKRSGSSSAEWFEPSIADEIVKRFPQEPVSSSSDLLHDFLDGLSDDEMAKDSRSEMFFGTTIIAESNPRVYKSSKFDPKSAGDVICELTADTLTCARITTGSNYVAWFIDIPINAIVEPILQLGEVVDINGQYFSSDILTLNLDSEESTWWMNGINLGPTNVRLLMQPKFDNAKPLYKAIKDAVRQLYHLERNVSPLNLSRPQQTRPEADTEISKPSQTSLHREDLEVDASHTSTRSAGPGVKTNGESDKNLRSNDFDRNLMSSNDRTSELYPTTFEKTKALTRPQETPSKLDDVNPQPAAPKTQTSHLQFRYGLEDHEKITQDQPAKSSVSQVDCADVLAVKPTRGAQERNTGRNSAEESTDPVTQLVKDIENKHTANSVNAPKGQKLRDMMRDEKGRTGSETDIAKQKSHEKPQQSREPPRESSQSTSKHRLRVTKPKHGDETAGMQTNAQENSDSRIDSKKPQMTSQAQNGVGNSTQVKLSGPKVALKNDKGRSSSLPKVGSDVPKEAVVNKKDIRKRKSHALGDSPQEVEGVEEGRQSYQHKKQPLARRSTRSSVIASYAEMPLDNEDELSQSLKATTEDNRPERARTSKASTSKGSISGAKAVDGATNLLHLRSPTVGEAKPMVLRQEKRNVKKSDQSFHNASGERPRPLERSLKIDDSHKPATLAKNAFEDVSDDDDQPKKRGKASTTTGTSHEGLTDDVHSISLPQEMRQSTGVETSDIVSSSTGQLRSARNGKDRFLRSRATNTSRGLHNPKKSQRQIGDLVPDHNAVSNADRVDRMPSGANQGPQRKPTVSKPKSKGATTFKTPHLKTQKHEAALGESGPTTPLIDEYSYRKDNIIDFGTKGPKNQGSVGRSPTRNVVPPTSLKKKTGESTQTSDRTCVAQTVPRTVGQQVEPHLGMKPAVSMLEDDAPSPAFHNDDTEVDLATRPPQAISEADLVNERTGSQLSQRVSGEGSPHAKSVQLRVPVTRRKLQVEFEFPESAEQQHQPQLQSARQTKLNVDSLAASPPSRNPDNALSRPMRTRPNSGMPTQIEHESVKTQNVTDLASHPTKTTSDCHSVLHERRGEMWQTSTSRDRVVLNETNGSNGVKSQTELKTLKKELDSRTLSDQESKVLFSLSTRQRTQNDKLSQATMLPTAGCQPTEGLAKTTHLDLPVSSRHLHLGEIDLPARVIVKAVNHREGSKESTRGQPLPSLKSALTPTEEEQSKATPPKRPSRSQNRQKLPSSDQSPGGGRVRPHAIFEDVVLAQPKAPTLSPLRNIPGDDLSVESRANSRAVSRTVVAAPTLEMRAKTDRSRESDTLDNEHHVSRPSRKEPTPENQATINNLIREPNLKGNHKKSETSKFSEYLNELAVKSNRPVVKVSKAEANITSVEQDDPDKTIVEDFPTNIAPAILKKYSHYSHSDKPEVEPSEEDDGTHQPSSDSDTEINSSNMNTPSQKSMYAEEGEDVEEEAIREQLIWEKALPVHEKGYFQALMGIAQQSLRHLINTPQACNSVVNDYARGAHDLLDRLAESHAEEAKAEEADRKQRSSVMRAGLDRLLRNLNEETKMGRAEFAQVNAWSAAQEKQDAMVEKGVEEMLLNWG